MPAWGPVSRRQLIAVLRRLGFEGPFAGAKHQFMVRGDRVLTVPNPHRGEIGVELLARSVPCGCCSPGLNSDRALACRG